MRNLLLSNNWLSSQITALCTEEVVDAINARLKARKAAKDRFLWRIGF